MAKIDNLLIPNISSLRSEVKTSNDKNNLNSKTDVEFKNLFEKELQQARVEQRFSGDQVHVSNHAVKRLEERNIQIDGSEYLKLKEAMTKLKAKGGHDSLVITDKAAYVVDVDKSTVVTAVDKNKMHENVFTKIDSTIFMN